MIIEYFHPLGLIYNLTICTYDINDFSALHKSFEEHTIGFYNNTAESADFTVFFYSNEVT
tara:strand:- start:174 stop:353 length:180 start_codon:yes stop_codon:yes gene_type:complete